MGTLLPVLTLNIGNEQNSQNCCFARPQHVSSVTEKEITESVLNLLLLSFLLSEILSSDISMRKQAVQADQAKYF